jgi:septal ring factor EnvC (AmiA/AmiB activator)
VKILGLQRLVFLYAGLTVLSGPLAAETPEATNAQDELSQIHQNLDGSKARQDALTQSIIEAQKAADAISGKLVEQGKTVEENRLAFEAADQKLAILEAKSVLLNSDLAARQDELASLLAGLQRLDLDPPPALIVEPVNVLAALRGAMMFGAVVPELRDKAKAVQTSLDELSAIHDESQTECEARGKAIADLQASQDELSRLQAEKKAQAEKAAGDLRAEKARAAELASKAKSLEDLLAALEKKKREDEAKQLAEAKAAEQAAADAKRKQDELIMQAALPLSAARGKLALPVNGRITRHFGDDTGLGTSLQGMAIGTEPNMNVISPVAAKVEFAGSFRSYGELLILNAGEGYLVLLAGMKQISVELGQTVKAGEPLGQMGDGPSNLAVLGETAKIPELYVEFRKDNTAIDPAPWWAADRKEAMK